MLVVSCIKISLMLIGFCVAIVSFVSLIKRNTTPLFSVVWVSFGIVLILAGIFIEPKNWAGIIGVPTLILIGILMIVFIVFFWFITKKIDELSHKFKELVIQTTLIRDENEKLKKELEKATTNLKTTKKALDQYSTKNNNHTLMLDNKLTGKNILFVNNTLSTGGAEKVMLTMMKRLIDQGNSVHLFVVTGMGELVSQLPDGVKLLNEHFEEESALSHEGKQILTSKVIAAQAKGFTGLRLFGYQAHALANMLRNGKIRAEKLVWRALSETAPKIKNEYDIAIAFTEGASTYYVAQNVAAQHKLAFVHISYENAGYSKQLDRNAYDAFDKIYAVSEEVKQSFLRVHPECYNKICIKENEINYTFNEELSKKEVENKFSCDKNDKIILTVARLVFQKSYDLIIEAAKILKLNNYKFKWVALGEGEDHSKIQELIDEAGLHNDFILQGNVTNPYPYMKNCDVFVHATRYEGKSVAIREAKALGCAMVVSDVPGNEDQIVDNYDGLICKLDPKDIASKIAKLLDNPKFANKLGQNAKIEETK